MASDVSRFPGPEQFRLTGEYDLSSGAALAHAFASGNGMLELDASAVEFIDSSGLHAIVEAAEPRGAVFVNTPPAVQRLLLLMDQSGMRAGITCR